MFKKLIAAGVLLVCASAPQAGTATYAGTQSANMGNCIPFGCPDSYGPHTGFYYKNIAPFTLNPGDVIAFDTGGRNDNDLSFGLYLASATSNGATSADANGFTFVSQLAPGHSGDDTIGNYDIAFVINTNFKFTGGGLIVDFLNTNGSVYDVGNGPGDYNLFGSWNSPYTLGRFYWAQNLGGYWTGDTGPVGNFTMTTFPNNDIPEPGSLALLGLGLSALASLRRRSKAA